MNSRRFKNEDRHLTLFMNSLIYPSSYDLVRSKDIAKKLQTWFRRIGVEPPLHIYNGSPWKNGHIEQFNGTPRHKMFNKAG